MLLSLSLVDGGCVDDDENVDDDDDDDGDDDDEMRRLPPLGVARAPLRPRGVEAVVERYDAAALGARDAQVLPSIIAVTKMQREIRIGRDFDSRSLASAVGLFVVIIVAIFVAAATIVTAALLVAAPRWRDDALAKLRVRRGCKKTTRWRAAVFFLSSLDISHSVDRRGSGQRARCRMDWAAEVAAVEAAAAAAVGLAA